MLIFVVTAGFAQLLGIGWKNKVLQLATGLSFYSAVDLIVSLVETLLRRSCGSGADPCGRFYLRNGLFSVGVYN